MIGMCKNEVTTCEADFTCGSDENTWHDCVCAAQHSGSSAGVATCVDDLKTKLPTSPGNKERQLLTNAKWWFDNAEKVQTRWQEWKLTR